MSMQFLHLYTRLRSLAVFRQLLKDKVLESLCNFLSCTGSEGEKVSLYSEFVSCVYSCGADSLAKHILNLVNDSENVYIRTVGVGNKPSAELVGCVNAELETLQAVAGLTPDMLKSNIGYNGFLPNFAVERVNIPAEYKLRSDNISVYGYGIYAKNACFPWTMAAASYPFFIPTKLSLPVSLTTSMNVKQ